MLNKISLKQWIIIDSLAACIFAAAWFFLFMPVTVTVDYRDLEGSKQYNTVTTAVDVRDFAAKRFPGLTAKDIVVPDGDTIIKRGTKITVIKGDRAEAEIAGKTEELYLLPVSVRKNLERNGVEYDSDDIIRPSLDVTVDSGTDLVVKDVEVREKQKKKKVKAEFEAVLDPSVKSGSIITREKKDGKGVFKIKTTYINGEKHKTEKELLKWITKPVNGKKTFGTSLTGHKGIVKYSKVFTSESTAYTERKGARGASGGTCAVGTCAVDPAKIPYGTELYVEGYGFAVANDCGGAIDGNDLDLYMNSEKACRRWGRRHVKVYVLSNSDRVTVKLDKETK